MKSKQTDLYLPSELRKKMLKEASLQGIALPTYIVRVLKGHHSYQSLKEKSNDTNTQGSRIQ